MLKLSRETFLKKFGLSPIYICYKGRLTELFIKKSIKDKLFSIHSELDCFEFDLNDSHHKIMLSSPTKVSGEYRLGKEVRDQLNVVEVLPSLSMLVKHVKASDSIKKMLTDLETNWTDENMKPIKEKGYRLFGNEINIGSNVLRTQKDIDTLENKMKFFINKNILNPNIQEEVLELCPTKIEHTLSNNVYSLNIHFYFYGNQKATSLKMVDFNGESVLIMNDPHYMTASMSTSREQMVQSSMQFFENKHLAWKELSQSKKMKVTF